MMTDAAIERSEKAVSLYRRGKTFREISKALKVSSRTIERDIDRARKEWREKASQSYDKHLHEQLAKIDEAEAAAWVGWERSLQDDVTTRTEDSETEGEPAVKTVITRRGQSGQPAFIAEITKLAALRCKLLGLLDQDARNESVDTENASVVSIVVGSREEADTLRTLTVSQYQAKLAESTGATS